MAVAFVLLAGWIAFLYADRQAARRRQDEVILSVLERGVIALSVPLEKLEEAEAAGNTADCLGETAKDTRLRLQASFQGTRS